MRKITNALLSFCMVLSLLSVSAFAADTEEMTEAGNKRVPVLLTQTASQFSVTVPTALPVVMEEDGTTSVADNCSIQNNGMGPVVVTNVAVEAQNSWKLMAFDTSFAEGKVGAKEFGLKLGVSEKTAANVVVTAETNNSQGTCAAKFGTINGKASCHIYYDANIAPQIAVLTNETIANVIFTVSWDKAAQTGTEIKTLTDVLDDEGNAVIGVGDSVNLAAIAVYSTETPTWETTAAGIVSVTEGGVAKGEAKGEADITVTLNGMTDTLHFIVKNKQNAPSAPTMASRTANSITLTATEGYEYSMNGTTWQDSATFSGLTAGTEYTFYQRIKGSADNLVSPASAVANISTLGTQSAPAAPTLANATDTTIELTSVSGCEYSKDGTTWQDSTTFTGLTAGKQYIFYQRYKAAGDNAASDASVGAAFVTKSTQVAPAAPAAEKAIVTANSITLEAIGGCEYKMNEGSWQDSPTFSDLTAGTEYTFYQRLKGTETLMPSPASGGTSITTTSAE